MVGPLNARQERFAQEYAAAGNATQAAITAGYSARTAQEQGSRLLSNVMVATRVAEFQVKAAARAEVTMESIAQQLDDDRKLAHKERQAGACFGVTRQGAADGPAYLDAALEVERCRTLSSGPTV